MKNQLRCLFLAVALVAFLFSCDSADEKSYRTWTTYSGDPAGSKYSDLDQINRENVTRLEPAWIFRTGDKSDRPATTIECNPIIVDGKMYLTSPGLKVMALNAATGKEEWRFDPFAGEGTNGVNRGVTYWADGNDRRIFFVAGAFLYGLNADNGALIESFADSGRVDLYQGLDRDVRTTWVTAVTPGIVYRDLLILGSTLGEGPGPAAPGHIRAYDVRTGELRWKFRTIPHPGEFGYETWPEDAWQRVGGANAWGGLTLDEKRGLVFCGTGSPTYDHWGGNRIGQNLFGNCILALNAATGERVWHYQVVHHDVWDYDIPCPPNLVQVKKGGKLIDAIAQPTKMGHLFVLDRETGEPIFPVEEMPVPQTEIPGEQTWPTQPFPPASLRYAQQRFTEVEATDLNPNATAFVKEWLKGVNTGDLFLPPSFKGDVTLPQFNGGTDWGGAAYDPRTRQLYVNTSNEAEWISMIKTEPEETVTRHALGQQLYRTICQSCHGYGNPRNPGSPSLTSLRKLVTEERTIAQLQDVLLNGKGSMPTFAALSDDERDAVIAFLRDEGQEEILERSALQLSFSEEIPYIATGHNEIKDTEGFPVNKRPWGTVSAIDLDAGRIVWQTALGTYPELEARGEPPTGTFNMGGPLVTAGGLVFIGGSMDERFHAYDKQTGKLLWEYQLDAGGYATPATYEINGKQYVVIAAGGGGKPDTKAGDAYYCFALPGK